MFESFDTKLDNLRLIVQKECEASIQKTLDESNAIFLSAFKKMAENQAASSQKEDDRMQRLMNQIFEREESSALNDDKRFEQIEQQISSLVANIISRTEVGPLPSSPLLNPEHHREHLPEKHAPHRHHLHHDELTPSVQHTQELLTPTLLEQDSQQAPPQTPGISLQILIPDLLHFCQICELSFQAFSDLLAHIETNHPPILSWHCYPCTLMFDNKEGLDNHMQNGHTL